MKEWKHYRYHIFVCVNTLLFIFTILYLGIHWFIDIPLGMIVGGVGALFIHHLQPRLRNDHGSFFKGFTTQKIRRHILVEGVVTLAMVTLIIMAVNVQSSTVGDRVSYQLGPEDSTFEIIQKFEPGETVDTTVTNLHQNITLEVVVLIVETAVPAMAEGSIDWEIMKTLGEYYTVAPNSTLALEIDAPKVYSLVVMHNPSTAEEEVVQVRVLNDYHQDLMWMALLLSMPSLWITGFVIHRLRRLNRHGRRWMDSTPSHIWESE
jgi:hypothetical protein